MADPIFLTKHPHRSSASPHGVRLDTHRGSGPGGQKRNKTSSAVRATHEATGLWAISDDSRDQRKNRVTALHRLRHELTVRCRERIFLDRLDPPAGFVPEWLEVPVKDDRYLPTLGYVLDVLLATGWEIARAAEHLGTTTGRLSKIIVEDPLAWAYVNRMRQSVGLRPLK